MHFLIIVLLMLLIHFTTLSFKKTKKKQIKGLKKFIKNWDSKSNLVLVTHYVVISEILSLGANSGEIIVTNKDFKTLGRIKID